MPRVYMDEVIRVQTVGPDGKGVYPPVTVEEVANISDTGREMKEINAAPGEIPNPMVAKEGTIMQSDGKSWKENDGGLPSASTATDGMVVVAQDGEWVAADASVLTDVADLVADGYSSSVTYDVGDYVVYDGKLYVCTTAIPEAEAWNAEHWTATTATEGLVLKATDSNGDGSVVLQYT